MSLYDRIAIGTANWRQKYNGCQVSEEQQQDIIDWCTKVGIHWIEIATAYETDDIRIPGWGHILKILAGSSLRHIDGNIDVVLGHSPSHYDYVLFNAARYPDSDTGLSTYDPLHWAEKPTWVEVPYSIVDRRLEASQCEPYIIARSVFLRGKCLKWAGPAQCVQFVLMNPKVRLALIGADNLQQLQESVGWISGWELYQCDDLDVIDPRRWD